MCQIKNEFGYSSAKRSCVRTVRQNVMCARAIEKHEEGAETLSNLLTLTEKAFYYFPNCFLCDPSPIST